ncbi:MAG: DNA polymerase III subunit delta [Prevotellaceae bacterium]|nr:DNA polymerase III subunit delta [Prevotellaceae bacterium]
MFFKEVIGQEEAKQKLLAEAATGHIPHARLFYGAPGAGEFPLAMAYARYLCCTRRTATDACGTCPSCVKWNKMVHPDVHFIFPIVKNAKTKREVCDDFLPQWRRFVLGSPYFTLNQWLDELGVENGQAMIYAKESDEITRKLNLKSSEGGYKITIVWLPEKMHETCANKLLKLLEEPPQKTLFFLVSEAPDLLLTTIQSRTQRFPVHPLAEAVIADALSRQYGIGQEESAGIARLAGGNFIEALKAIHLDEAGKQYFEWFVSLMRLSYQRKIREMKQWSEQVAAIGRERQKSFLAYCQRMVRESFIYNRHAAGLNYMTGAEESFVSRFAPFVNRRNVEGIMQELSLAETHIEQNVNARMVFFDFALKMIVLLKS